MKSTSKPVLGLLAATAVLVGTATGAKASGPEVYIGRLLVESATNVGSGQCDSNLTQGASFGAILRIPAATPNLWKIDVMNDHFALRVSKLDATSVAATIFDTNGSVGSGTGVIKSGGKITYYTAAETGTLAGALLNIEIKVPGQCELVLTAITSLTSLG